MYRLIKTKRVRRVLFLVDRRSLGIQAADALGDIKIENLSVADIYDVKSIGEPDPETATKIHISTVQGMVKRLFILMIEYYLLEHMISLLLTKLIEDIFMTKK